MLLSPTNEKSGKLSLLNRAFWNVELCSLTQVAFLNIDDFFQEFN